MQKLLKSYLKKLTNLSSRNRSLLLLNLPSRHFIDIQELDYAIDKSAFELITEVLEQKNKINTLTYVSDSLHDELFIIKVELGRHELTRDYFFKKHPELQLEYENFINHETE